ncbi:MAG: dTDP-4-dehydrorhamnose 3,5-epimerase [Verrucomicrobia bacterium]|nr:dTDP-4-dehydrorhamnose 3,5-epimerase [Verrucomicrobiota bacterium]
MRFTETAVTGVWLVELDLVSDDRGWFARTWCAREFEQRGLNSRLVQCNASFNARRGTLRGMHWQIPPHAETKLVRCVRGRIYDVVMDIRRDSPTYCQWCAFELAEGSGQLLYIPEGVAHGFLSLTDETEVLYQMSEVYAPDLARGIRWDDPAFGIAWPLLNPILSERDRSYPDFHV